MKKKVLVTLNDPGSVNALSSSLIKLREDFKLETLILSESPQKVFDDKNIAYKTLQQYDIKDLDPESTEYIFKKENPDLVLTGVSVNSNIERYFIYIARTNNILSISMFEGYTFSTVRFKDEQINPRFRFRPDFLLVLDKIAVEIMMKEGFKEEQLIITGHPAYDDLLKVKQSFNEQDFLKVRTDLGIEQDSYLTTFLSQPLLEDMQAGSLKDFGYTQVSVLSDLESALQSLDIQNLTLLVKIHDREREESTKSAFKGKLRKVLFDRKYDTRLAILASDLITGMVTNALIEAVYLDKDVVSLQPGLFEGYEDRLITNKLGLSIPVYKKDDIMRILKKVMHDERFKEELRQRRSKLSLDGKATERVVNFVYKLLNV